MRRRQNNPLLIGDPGVGKTALVEALANAVAKGDVPPAFSNIIVRTLISVYCRPVPAFAGSLKKD